MTNDFIIYQKRSRLTRVATDAKSRQHKRLISERRTLSFYQPAESDSAAELSRWVSFSKSKRRKK